MGFRCDCPVYTLPVVDAFTNSIVSDATESLTIDTTPPEPVTGFSATASANLSVILTWTNPTVADFASIIIRRSEDGYPASVNAGDAVTTNAMISTLYDSGLLSGTHYYAIFSLDSLGNISTEATAVITLTVSEDEFEDGLNLDRGDLVIETPKDTVIENPVIGSQGNTNVTVNAALKSSGLVLGNTASGVSALYVATQNAVVSDSANAFTWTGGSLSVRSAIGNVANNGGRLIVKSGAPVSISGNYTQGSTGQIEFILQHRNTNAALIQSSGQSERRLLQVDGDVSISGTVQVTIDGYQPRPGDRIQVMKPSNVSGALSILASSSTDIDFDLPTLPNGMSWDVSQFESEDILNIQGDSSKLVQARPLNYPNPFTLSSGTDIVYFLNDPADIELRIYSASGHEVYRDYYAEGFEGGKAGNNYVPLNRMLTGHRWPSGVYFYVLMHDRKVVAKGKLAVLPE